VVPLSTRGDWAQHTHNFDGPLGLAAAVVGEQANDRREATICNECGQLRGSHKVRG
jgi:hypothetical protein